MKKYLKTPEEVIDALHEGKTVFSGIREEYKLYKGLVIGKFKYGGYIINTNIPDLYQPYIKGLKRSKIKVGKFYKRRDGKKARCYYINGRSAYFTVDEELSVFSTYLAGNVFTNKEPCEYDIIGPWEE